MPKTVSQLPAASSASRSAVVAADNAAATLTEKVTLGQIASLGSAFVTVGRGDAMHNGTGTAESPADHVAIQAAVDAVAATGGTVYILPGTYYLGDTITISSPNIAVVGAGRSSLLMCVGDYGDVFDCGLPEIPTQWPGMAGLQFQGLRFETTVERTSGAAIRARYTHNAIFRDIYISDNDYGISYGLITPVPAAFYDGIYLDAQNQCHVEKVTAQCVNYGVHVNGSGYANASFSYDGYIHNCNFWGSPGTRRGTGIHLGANCGGFLIDFISSNQLEYGVYADASGTTQGGGIITIRGGYVENAGHGYHINGYQRIVVESLWGDLVVNSGALTVIGVPNGSITINGGTALIFGSPASVSGTGTWNAFPGGTGGPSGGGGGGGGGSSSLGSDLASFTGEAFFTLNDTVASLAGGLNLAYTATPGYAAGVVGNALSLTSQRVYARNVISALAGGQWGVSFWCVRPEAGGANTVASIGCAGSSPTTGPGIDFYAGPAHGSGLQVYLGASEIASGSMATGAWNHILVSYDGANTTIYLNNSLAGTYSGNALDGVTGSDVVFWNPTNSAFKIDAVRIQSAAFTSGDRATLYGSGSGYEPA